MATTRRRLMLGALLTAAGSIPPNTLINQADAFLPCINFSPIHHRSSFQRTTKSAVHSTRRPLHEIIQELESKGIRFRPTATRSELENLLADSRTTSSDSRQDRELHSQPPVDAVKPSERRWPDGSDQSSISGRNANNSVNRPRSGRRAERQSRMQHSEVDDTSMDDVFRDRDARRRRRERQQKQRRPISASGTIFRVVDKTTRALRQAIPEQVVDIGSKATRIATRKTQQLFDELVDATYDDLESPRPRATKRRHSAGSRVVNSNKRRSTFADFAQEVPEQNVPGIDERKFSTKGPRSSPRASSTLSEETLQHLESDSNTNSRSEKPKMPIGEILSELDSRKIRYSPQATRMELERLLKEARRTETVGNTAETLDANAAKEADHGIRHQTEKDSYKEALWGRAARVASKKVKSIPGNVKDRVRGNAKSTYQKAKTRVSGIFQKNDGVDGSTDDTTPIVVDAVIEDFSISKWDDDDVIDIQPHPSSRSRWRRQRPKPDGNSNGHSTRTREVRGTSRTNPVRSERSQSAQSTSERRHVVSYESPLQLPASKIADNQQSRAGRGARRHAVTGRKIYSPYPTSINDESRENIDGLDQLGGFFADSVDSFLWGTEDGETRRPQKRSPKASPSGGSKTRSGHWKDRMEEQFDYFMGIHQDGKYYNRWVNQEKERERNVEGTDAVSYARGRAPRPGSRRRMYEKPIWEEEDSWLSMFFGTDRQANRRNDLFSGPSSILDSGSLLKVLRTLLRSSARLAGGVCRWASVRGSLPQPIVVVGVLSAVLCSRPGSRVRNVFLALLSVRAVGELLNGHMYDDADFWEPEENDDERDEPRPTTTS